MAAFAASRKASSFPLGDGVECENSVSISVWGDYQEEPLFHVFSFPTDCGGAVARDILTSNYVVPCCQFLRQSTAMKDRNPGFGPDGPIVHGRTPNGNRDVRSVRLGAGHDGKRLAITVGGWSSDASEEYRVDLAISDLSYRYGE